MKEIGKRRLRFSIGAMLVLMTGAAVLLGPEVQRANAIKETVHQIKEWKGVVGFRSRASCPPIVWKVLPKYWVEEIDSILLAAHSGPQRFGARSDVYSVINRSEVEKIVQLGALNDLKRISLMGNTFNYDYVYYLCKSTAVEECTLISGDLSDQEIAVLKEAFPHCKFSTAGW